MEAIISIVSELGQYMVSPVLHHLGYLFRYKKNIDELRNEIRRLKYVKDRLQHAVDDATMKGDEIEVEVQTWLTKVCGICEETEKYLEHEGQANTKCSSIGSFPNLALRHRISRKAKKMKEAIFSEIQNGNRFDKVSYRPVLERIVDVKGYEAFETRTPILREIMEALKDPNVSMVGLFGMGGVGKTMLAKEVARRTKEENVFTHVVVATVSQTPNYKKFQLEIGDRLGLEFTEKCLSARGDRLRHRLRPEKKMLIIVDDVWEKLDLHDVGISFGDDQKGCKILLTSRFQDVLCNDMGVEKNFKIELLSEDEARSLFGKIVGDFVKNFDLQPLATQIVRECACLPIAITTVANALKNKSYPVWKDALQELKMSNPTNIKGMHANVYSTIKLSYNFLGSEEAKSLLLLCSLHEEDANITLNYLVKYGVGLGMFQGITKLEEARNRVLTLFESLKSSCLLLDGDYADTVKMHDVVRDVITSIGSKERQIYNIGSVAEINECLKKKKLKESYAISLLSTNVDKLPDRMECPLLEFFFINSINQSLEIPDNFFQETKELQVLDLTFLCFERLPSSLCFLQNLQTLCLFQCKLGDISLLGELKNLEILDLSRTNIKQLPEQIGQLTNLRLLDLRCCYDLEVIQPNIISNLQRLEELNMKASFTKWEIEGVNAEQSNANIRELKHLSHLTTLYMHIPHVNIVPEDLFSEKLERFNILVGDVFWYDKHGRSNPRTMLKLKLNKSCLLDKHGLKLLLERSEELYLDGIEGVNNVVYELHKEGFPRLKHLEFENNTEIRYILQPMEEIVLCSAFPSLESLYLNKLIVLENIFHGKLTAGSFGKLKSITVIKCDRLKSIFSLPIVKQLEEIEVSECKIMQEIVTCGNEHEAHSANNVADDVIVFTQLHSLILQSLPNLIQFFQSESREGHLFANVSMPLFNGKVNVHSLNLINV